MVQYSSIHDARKLRESGKLAGYRPKEPLNQGSLAIELPSLEKAPAKPVDAMLIMGMGPVKPTMVMSAGQKTVGIGDYRMRHNALSGIEMAVNGYVKNKGFIIPSGTATADPTQIALSKLNLQDEEKIYRTTEASIIANFFSIARAKNGKKINQTEIEVIEENQATETIENYIFTLNILDNRYKKLKGKLFDGSLMVITSRYHIARVYDIAYYLGISEKVVPLVSQEVLKFFGYSDKDYLYDKEFESYNYNNRWDEQKWIRVIHQLPRYFLTELLDFEDESRLINTLKNLKKLYGAKIFKEFGLDSLSLKNVSILRSILSSFQRTNPLEEEWLKFDTLAIDKAIDFHVNFTQSWLKKNSGRLTRLNLSRFLVPSNKEH